MTTIETERLILRRFTLGDTEGAYEALDVHPDVWRFDPGFKRSREQRRQVLVGRIAEYDTAWGKAGIGLRAVVLKESGELIGYAGLQVWLSKVPLVAEDGPYASFEVEYYYKLGREYWGRGIATEAGVVVLEFAFAEIRLRRIATVTNRDNSRSIGLLRRLGAAIVDSPTDPQEVIGLIQNPHS